MFYNWLRLQRVGLALLLILGIPFTAQGALPGTQKLRGEVVDQNSAPIAGAVCTLRGRTLPEQGRRVTTGDKGIFEFTGLIPGTYGVTCASVGYEPVAKTDIQVTENEEPITLRSSFLTRLWSTRRWKLLPKPPRPQRKRRLRPRPLATSRSNPCPSLCRSLKPLCR